MNTEEYNNQTIEELEKLHKEKNYILIISDGRITCAQEKT